MNTFEIIQSIFYRLKFNDKRYKYYRQLKKNLYLNREEIIENQNTSIKKLVLHAYNETVYYKELLDNFNIDPNSIKNKEDLKRIPVLTKSIIRENIDKLKSKGKYGKTLFKVTSGGSTGVQAVIYKSKYFEQVSRASVLRNNSITGWLPSSKSVWIWGSPIEHSNIKNSILSKIGFRLNRRIIFNAYNYSESDFFEWIKKINQYKPEVLFGYASIILEFSKFLIHKEIRLDSIKRVISTTEKLNRRDIIEKAFNCKVFDQYGCREILSIGIEGYNYEMIQFDDVVILNTDESGEFLLTALYSYGFPLINYKVGDIGEYNNNLNEPLSKDYPFPIMNLKIGRTTDNFFTFEGKKISSSALSTFISTCNVNVSEHQIIQKDYKQFCVNYVTLSVTDENSYMDKIKKCLSEYFGEDIYIEFNKVESIPIEKSGKRLLFKRDFLIE